MKQQRRPILEKFLRGFHVGDEFTLDEFIEYTGWDRKIASSALSNLVRSKGPIVKVRENVWQKVSPARRKPVASTQPTRVTTRQASPADFELIEMLTPDIMFYRSAGRFWKGQAINV